MKVAIVGGHGKIAQHLTGALRSRGDEVASVVRNPAHADDVAALGAAPVVCDLERDSPADLAAAVSGCEAVVFAAGAGPGSGAARKETVDYGGAVATIDAARAAGIERYVMISAVRANASRDGDEVFDVYLRAKGRADDALRASGLAYTVVRPVRLTDEAASGHVEVGAPVASAHIARADVAAVTAAVLDAGGTSEQTFDVASGHVPVEEAVATLVASPRRP